jgi:hypothetical protein
VFSLRQVDPAQFLCISRLLALIPGAEINEAFHKYERDIKFLQGGSLPPLSPGPASEGRYHTFTAPAFNLGDAEEINSGRKVMFVLGKVRWSDDTGSYELPFSMFFSAEPAPYTGFNWHTTKEDGHERKLR